MIAIIKYNAGNSRSVSNALNRLGYERTITSDISTIQSADKVIFPGVGEAASAMDYLKRSGLDEVIKSIRNPFLGICLGQQLMCRFSEEGKTRCLGIFDAKVKRFPAKGKVPHVGWNNFIDTSGLLFDGVDTHSNVYYTHSFYVESCRETVASCNYILPFSSAMQKDNYFTTQFHPEKSGEAGERILLNFLNL